MNELEKEVKFLQEELNDKKTIIKNLIEKNSYLFLNCSKIEDENKSLKNEINLLQEQKQDLILELSGYNEMNLELKSSLENICINRNSSKTFIDDQLQKLTNEYNFNVRQLQQSNKLLQNRIVELLDQNLEIEQKNEKSKQLYLTKISELESTIKYHNTDFDMLVSNLCSDASKIEVEFEKMKKKFIKSLRDTSSETSENYDEIIEKLSDENKNILMKVKELEDNSIDVNKLESKLRAYKKTVKVLKYKMMNYNEKFTPQSKENLEKAEISLQTEPVESLSEIIELKVLYS